MYSEASYAKLTNEEKLKIVKIFEKSKKLEDLQSEPFERSWNRIKEYVDIIHYMRSLTTDIPEFAFLDAVTDEGDVCNIAAYGFAYTAEDKDNNIDFRIKFFGRNSNVDKYKSGELYDAPCIVITPINDKLMPLVIEFYDDKIMELIYHEMSANYSEINIKNKYTIKAVYFDDGERVNILNLYRIYFLRTYCFNEFAFETHNYKTNFDNEVKYINKFYGKADAFIKAFDELNDPKDFTAIYYEDINKYFGYQIKINICNDEKLDQLRSILYNIASANADTDKNIGISVGDSDIAPYLDSLRVYFNIEFIPNIDEVYPVIDKLLDEKIKALEEN